MGNLQYWCFISNSKRVFLPQIIPVHFANGIADDFGNKVEIFYFLFC